MTKEQLHNIMDQYFAGHKRRTIRALVHALIDLGQVTSLECQWDQCALPGVTMLPLGRGAACVSLDHIVAVADGGSDRFGNLQLIHHTCNMRKGAIFTEARRQRMGDASRQRWQDPTYRARLTGRAQSVEERARRAAAIPRGDEHWTRKNPERLPRGDSHWAKRKVVA